jgi:putative membrane protein
MKRYLINTALAAALTVPSVAIAQTAAPAQTTQEAVARTAAEFVPMAAYSNRFEIESSELALEQAQSASVRSFAQRMVQDHTAAGQELQQAVEAAGGSLTVPADLDARHADMVEELRSTPADQFDTTYVQMQNQAHEEAVALFQGFAQTGESGPVRDFAESTLPVLQEHYQMVSGMEPEARATGAAKGGAMSSPESGATTAASGEQGSSPEENTTPSGGVIPGQDPQ